MQYLVCGRCGFANELIETACVKCGFALDRDHPADSSQFAQPLPQSAAHHGGPALGDAGKAAGAVFRAAIQPLDNLEGEYPWLHRFIRYIRTVAKLLYILGLLQALLILVGGIIAAIAGAGQSEGFGSGTLMLVGGVLVSLLGAALTYLLVWLGYMFMMALPDFLECVLRIEGNTRKA
jgi:hypothetical protein